MQYRVFSPLAAKLLTIAGLAIVLIFPVAQVRSLVDERNSLRDTAVSSIAADWGGRQVVAPPILAIPWEIVTRDGEYVSRRAGVVHALAARTSVEASLVPEVRHLGIYSVPVYVASVQIAGELDAASLAELREEMAGRTVHWARARLILPVAAVRGIREVKAAQWGTGPVRLEPASYQDLPGVGGVVDASPLATGGRVPFRFDLRLAGSEALQVLPLARTTTTRMTSSWPHPNFSVGEFLPASYSLRPSGFDAHWQVLELNRNFPQSWAGDATSAGTLLAAGYGVELHQPVDTYQRNERAIKYAVLFIAITLMSIFLWEHLTGLRLHAVQYFMVGLALSVFYLLLLAFSEHLAFGLAYLIAAAALTALLGIYLAGALRSRRAGTLAAGTIASVYGLLYLLVLSEQYALLLGALLVFGVLAAIMLVTRRLDWHALGSKQDA
ncbi:MAG TPA: cell envelope integrity protein CreD [Steroidobacteraceae bacterium]|nr:cell envelope integrity protein CreD [Steroidobacteraceae bacterium]